MLDQMVGRLRGHGRPSDEILQRLEDMNPRLRVSWTPPVAGVQPAFWWLHEVRPHSRGDELRRKAGAARLSRIRGWPIKMQLQRVADEWQAEEWMDGLYDVGRYTEQEFGTEKMFAELTLAHQIMANTDRGAAVLMQQEQQAWSDVEFEQSVNLEFAAFCRELAEAFYPDVAGVTPGVRTKHSPPAPIATEV